MGREWRGEQACFEEGRPSLKAWLPAGLQRETARSRGSRGTLPSGAALPRIPSDERQVLKRPPPQGSCPYSSTPPPPISVVHVLPANGIQSHSALPQAARPTLHRAVAMLPPVPGQAATSGC